MSHLSWFVVVIGSYCAAESSDVSSSYKALRCPQPTVGTTWAVLERDGANRKVDPYLSSLGQGETGTGTITSAPFAVETDTIRFTIRGHDGSQGGRGENYIALLDARKGTVLLKTEAPANDALQERSWDVAAYKGAQVRVEVCDGNQATMFAWLGIGSIDAGPGLKVDFRNGIPEGWSRPERAAEVRTEVIQGAVPFQRNMTASSIIPGNGQVELPCGFSAKRIFLLGCTVSAGQPLVRYGAIEVHYASGTVDVFHLTYGFTLDGQNKVLSPSKAMYLGRSDDPFQYVLSLAPSAERIDMIRLVSNPERNPVPLITAITCETADTSENLLPLPKEQATAEATAWIASHTLTPTVPDRAKIEQELREAHQSPIVEAGTVLRFRPHQLDAAFRSEGVAIADFNGDGKADIAAGSVYYAGPDWAMQPLLANAQEFPEKGYSDAFLCFDDDVNRDGAVDLIVVGFPGQQTYWLANPRLKGSVWTKHLAIANTGSESPDYVDVDGDGTRELVFMQGDRCALARPDQDPTKLWTITVVATPGDPGPGHGLGIGDVNRDSRLDLLCPNGWWEQPAQSASVPWPFHRGGVVRRRTALRLGFRRGRRSGRSGQ